MGSFVRMLSIVPVHCKVLAKCRILEKLLNLFYLSFLICKMDQS